MDGPLVDKSDAVSIASALACVASALGVGTRGMEPGARVVVLGESESDRVCICERGGVCGCECVGVCVIASC